MAKQLHLVHRKSSVAGKVPSASTINYGEIAVNYNDAEPTLFIRTNEDRIESFVPTSKFEDIVGDGFESGKTITEVIEEDELVVEAAVNDLNNKLAITGVTQTGSGNAVVSATVSNKNLTITNGNVGGGDAVWGGITGTLSAQTDLNAALNGKQNNIDSSHKLDYSLIANTPTIPSAPGTLTTTAATSLSTATNESLSGSVSLHKISKTGSYNDLNNKPTIPSAANNGTLTIQKNGTSVGTFTADQSGNSTVNIVVNELPTVTSANNGQVLQVVNGVFTLVNPINIYTGSDVPSSSFGNNGDVYFQI